MSYDFDKIQADINHNAYQRLGSGSGRRVYDLGNGLVVKVAKNKKGLAQNRTELLIGEQDKSQLLAKIQAVSEDFFYLIMDKAERIDDISVVWNYYKVKNNREMIQLPEIMELNQKYELLFADLYRPANWGIIDNKPVIVDYGYTKDVKRQFYSRLRI